MGSEMPILNILLVFMLLTAACTHEVDKHIATLNIAEEQNSSELYSEVIGSGRPLVLLHGFGANVYTWKGIIPSLSANHKIIAIDLKGFGKSDKPQDNHYSARDQAALVSSLIIDQQLSDFTIVGHSFGGAVALLTAIELKEKGYDKLQSMVLIDPVAYDQSLPTFISVLRLPILGKILLQLIPEEFQAKQILRLVYHDQSKITPETIHAYATPLKESAAKWALQRTSDQLIPSDLPTIISKYKTLYYPTLIIVGKFDNIVPPELPLKLSLDLPLAKLVTISSGHAPQEESPAETTELILNFFALTGG